MMKFFVSLFICFIFCIKPVYSQTDFRKGLESFNPIARDTKLKGKEKIKIYETSLEKAIQEKKPIHQLYCLLFIFYEYLRSGNYPEATQYILKAETIAQESNNPGWQGWVNYRRGNLFVYSKKEIEAIESYKLAIDQCRAAGDSLCVGESMEQISAMNSIMGNYEEAQRYFDWSMPLLKKFGAKKHVGTALLNHGVLTSAKGQPAKAIPYLREAIAANREIERWIGVAKGMNNLADAYRRLDSFDRAIEIFQECIKFNTEKGFKSNLIANYMGIHITSEAKGDFQTATEYLIKRTLLRDSINGVEVQAKITKLEVEHESRLKELEIQKSQAELTTARRSLERDAIIIIALLLFIALGLWLWRRKTHRAKIKQEENQQNLLDLTKLLMEKNTMLTSLKAQVSEQSTSQQKTSSEKGEPLENLYDQRILTKADWAKFKVLFEKAYPGYLLRLRSYCPSLSEAEERLFLFIKLNLTRRETATILGISADSVKKTRNRLRKRLELDEKDSLEDYVQNF